MAQVLEHLNVGPKKRPRVLLLYVDLVQISGWIETKKAIAMIQNPPKIRKSFGT